MVLLCPICEHNANFSRFKNILCSPVQSANRSADFTFFKSIRCPHVQSANRSADSSLLSTHKVLPCPIGEQVSRFSLFSTHMVLPCPISELVSRFLFFLSKALYMESLGLPMSFPVSPKGVPSGPRMATRPSQSRPKAPQDIPGTGSASRESCRRF